MAVGPLILGLNGWQLAIGLVIGLVIIYVVSNLMVGGVLHPQPLGAAGGGTRQPRPRWGAERAGGGATVTRLLDERSCTPCQVGNLPGDEGQPGTGTVTPTRTATWPVPERVSVGRAALPTGTRAGPPSDAPSR